MSDHMKALILHAPNEYGIEQVQKPSCPDRGVLIRVMACGLCGSDLRTLRSGHRNIKSPRIIGHEIAGEILKTGRAYEGRWKTGDIIAVAPTVYCGICDFCIEGRYELCDNLREIAQQWPGGFAEYMAVPAEALTLGAIQAVPEGMDYKIAAVAEPASSVVNAQEKGQVGLGDTVVIIGSGPIGCIHASVARARGAAQVIVADVFDERLKLCELFGPDITINASKVDLVEEVKKTTGGKGAEVVITANPVAETQIQAVEMAGKGGRILLFGGLPHDKCKPGIDTNLIHYKGLHVIGTTTFAPRHHMLALSMMRTGRIPGDKLVTHVLPLEDFKKGVALTAEGKALKVVFVP